MNGWLKFVFLWLALTAIAVLIGLALDSLVASFLAGIVSGCATAIVSVERGWILS